MKLSQFKFKLTEDRIAQEPTPFRDDCRLMVVHAKSGVLEHRESFRAILDYFQERDVFVFNDTKVFPARLYGNKEKTGARIEVFLLRELNAEMRLWDVLVDPARKIRIGNKLYFGEDESLVAEVIDNTTSRGRTLRFLYDGSHEEFRRVLFSLGEAPIPKDILRRDARPEDLEDFQCIFARKEGAVTAPTAGLHFSPQLLKIMEIRGMEFAYVTTHCGLGNFREIDVEDLTKHKTDSEEIHVDKEACDIINAAKSEGRKIVAVGTTVQRALETAVSADDRLKPFDGWTNKFIFPPYDFKIADAMIANFYLPYSTMLMLTAAFGGYELTMRAYKEALRLNEFDTNNRYRFGTYGDAMLILND
ncbi:MAG: tRNA preQ1(34) S-adenosylmethionine ribosyltransferase-isomerase QueA [Bacteroidaceae bacterium]|nr:tRNA preQ1(34) S-adenosylmethionine ribosyltransferase-isomerase QueA [Bacteroidaceae bacterium]